MIHHILVTVETDDRDMDAPPVEVLMNEVLNNLEYEAHHIGVLTVSALDMTKAFAGMSDE